MPRCRIHEASIRASRQPGTNSEALELIAGVYGCVHALAGLLSVPYCSGQEAAVKLLGGLAQNIAGMAVEIVREGERTGP